MLDARIACFFTAYEVSIAAIPEIASTFSPAEEADADR